MSGPNKQYFKWENKKKWNENYVFRKSENRIYGRTFCTDLFFCSLRSSLFYQRLRVYPVKKRENNLFRDFFFPQCVNEKGRKKHHFHNMITINFLMHISIPIIIIINLKAFKQIDESHFKFTPIQIFKFSTSTMKDVE